MIRERLFPRQEEEDGASEAQVDALSKELTARAYTAGEAVVVEGEQGEEMYFLTQGDATAEVEGRVRDRSTSYALSSESQI